VSASGCTKLLVRYSASEFSPYWLRSMPTRTASVSRCRFSGSFWAVMVSLRDWGGPGVNCPRHFHPRPLDWRSTAQCRLCLLYTSDAADDLLCVDLGGRRI